MRQPPSLLLAAVALVAASESRGDEPSRVRITAVEIAPSSYNGPGPIFRKGHPARFQVTLVNYSDHPTRGVLAAQVTGNLETVHGLPSRAVELEPRSREAITITWDYPGTLVFEGNDGQSIRIPGPRWGLTLDVAWRDETGHDLARAKRVFGIDRGGAEGPVLSLMSRTPGRQSEWGMRHSGYFSNPDLTPVEPPTDFKVKMNPGAVTRWRRGVGPGGYDTCLADLRPDAVGAPVVLEHADGRARLLRAWLLEPDREEGPRASRLRHLSDLKTYRFAIPSVPRGGVLVLEFGPSQYVPPVSLERLATGAIERFGVFADPLTTPDGKPIRTLDQWAGVRRLKERALRTELGLDRPRPAPDPQPRVLSEEAVPSRLGPTGWTGAYLRRKVSILAGPGERINVWLLIPPGLGPYPAVLACHQTVSEGKDEPVGLGGNVWQLDFGPHLVSRGFVVAAVDSPTFGERFNALSEAPQDTTRLTAADPGWSLLARRFADHARTLDYLETLPFVARTRLGVIGHSLGGESATALAALDDRVRCAVISCGFTLLRTLEHARETYAANGHAILPPRLGPLLDVPVGRRRLPFDFDDLMAMWAPRPVFYHEVRDELPQFTSAPQTLQAALALRRIYDLHRGSDAYYVIVSAQAHCFPRWVQEDAFDWLSYWLAN